MNTSIDTEYDLRGNSASIPFRAQCKPTMPIAAKMVTQIRDDITSANNIDDANRPDTHLAMGNRYDAIVIGAGFGGLRMLHELRGLGLTCRVIEESPDVGGTWYTNRYPGARTDSESFAYILNFSKELRSEWVWKERYPARIEVYRYLQHVADRFDFRRDIVFNTRVKSAHYDENQRTWQVATIQGKQFTCTYFISATGPLSAGLQIPYPGLDSFQGELFLASQWPENKVEFAGKRVAVVGTGATGVQIIPIVAHTAKHITVFQRTPNYVLPARNMSLTDDHLAEIWQNYDDIWEQARRQVFGFPIPTSGRTMENVTDDNERQRILEAGWEAGGFRFICSTFDDVSTNASCNALASEFVRHKIRTIVSDKRTADLLCPRYSLTTKRPPLGHFYYETYNRPNVKLVDISEDNIRQITSKGLRTSSAEYEFDMIIFAIGFDAFTGPLSRIDVRGFGNRLLSTEWERQLRTYLGILMQDYPNMFMISGPQGPFGNAPVYIDAQAAFIGTVIAQMRNHGFQSAEPNRQAVDRWCKAVKDSYEATVIAEAAAEVGSWYTGGNVPGKRSEILLFFGGVQKYIEYCEREAATGFPGMRFI